MAQRYKDKRLLLCKRQMEEVVGEPSDQKWTARFFEIWPITVQVQERAQGHVNSPRSEVEDLVEVYQDVSRLAQEQENTAVEWEQEGSV